jgi:RimJ/RimL family protein N-acetyltransferase
MHDHMHPPEIETERLLLRRWRDTDREPFGAMCADLRVMEFFPSTQRRDQADAVIDRLNGHTDRHGFGFWALEERSSGEFLGFTGLSHVGFTAPFTPAVEIGWRLAHRFWGMGYAREAALASLGFGFGALKLEQIVSFAAIANLRSRRVMERIGMRHDPGGEFDMPTFPEGHALRRHAFYRIRAEDRPARPQPIWNGEALS